MINSISNILNYNYNEFTFYQVVELIRYLAVGRPDQSNAEAPKHEILSSLLTSDSDTNAKTYKKNAVQILGKSHKLESGKRVRLTADDYEIHVQLENGAQSTPLLLIAITDQEFGAHHNVTSFFQEWISLLSSKLPRSDWNEKKNRLSRRIDPVLLQIHRKYNTSSIMEANRKVDQVKGVMTDNIQMALQNAERIDELEQKSENIEESAKEFESKAKKVRCRFIKERIKIIGLIAVIALVIIAVIVISIVIAKKT